MNRLSFCLAICMVAMLSASFIQAADFVYGSAPPANLGGPIDLIDQSSHHFSLQDQTGRPALVYFGFTQCSVSCPVALFTAKQLLNDPAIAARVRVVFITLDPIADDSTRLAGFLRKVDSRIIGLTGTLDAVLAVATRYGVAASDAQGQLVHSSVWYLVNGSGVLERVYPSPVTAAQLNNDLQRYLSRESR